MKFFFFIILLTLTTKGLSQIFAPVGSVWHYTLATINPGVYSYKSLESLSDTTILGKPCRKIIEVDRIFDTTSVNFHYIYENQDSVFFFKNSSFHLLYNFSAPAGDSILLGNYSNHLGQPVYMRIDSTATTVINSTTKKVQYVSCGDGISIEFSGEIIEDIGNTFFLFPRGDLDPTGPLRCYQDSLLGSYINTAHPPHSWNFLDCDQVITHSGQIASASDIHIFPNPSSASITIQNIEPNSKFQIYNMLGKLELAGNLLDRDSVNISILPKGIYLVRISNGNTSEVVKLIKK